MVRNPAARRVAEGRTFKESRKAACREALINAAQELLAERGFEGATVEAIARRAGVAKGTFYLHFSGKDEVFSSLIQVQTERILREAERVAASAIPAREKLRSIAEKLIAFHGQASHAWLSLVHAKGIDRRLVMAHHFRGNRQRMLVTLRAVINDGMTDGQIAKEDPDRIAGLFLGCVQGIVQRRMEGAAPGDDRGEAVWLVERLFYGVAPAAGGVR